MPTDRDQTFAERSERLRLAAKVVFYDRDNDEAWDELDAALDALDPRNEWAVPLPAYYGSGYGVRW